ncbi:hypothetical protein EV1_040154 [Malus domestica]
MGTSRAVLGKQSGKGSRQSVPDRKIDTKCWLIAFFILVPQVRTRTKKMTGRKHDMKYSCFRSGDLTALHNEALLFGDGAVNICGSFLSSSTQTPSAKLTVQAAFFSVCFFCTLSLHAARYHFHLPYLFSRSTSAAEDEYSRAMPGKNKDKGKDREKA